jgi:hypothetical protein
MKTEVARYSRVEYRVVEHCIEVMRHGLVLVLRIRKLEQALGCYRLMRHGTSVYTILHAFYVSSSKLRSLECFHVILQLKAVHLTFQEHDFMLRI